MRKLEAVNPLITDTTKNEIKEFWTKNVNAEELFGKKVSGHNRGDNAYFLDLEQQRYRSHRHLLPWIQQMDPGKSVLEVGCGIGMDLYKMAQHGLKVTGIDLTDIAIATVRQRFEQNGLVGNFKTGDATNLQFEDNSFDYVYSFGVLHHTQDTEKAIDEVFRVLKKGGTAKIMLYNRHSLNELAHRLTRIPFEDKNELCPVVRRFTTREIQHIFKKFDNIDIKKDFVYGEGYGIFFKLTPRPIYNLLSSLFGWHLMITSRK